MSTKVYVLDGDLQYATLLKGICQSVGIDAEVVDSYKVFARHLPPSGILLLDLKRPYCDSFEVIRMLARQSSKLKLILMSGYDTDALNMGTNLALEYHLTVLASFNKPVLVPPLLQVIRQEFHTGVTSGIPTRQDKLLLNRDELISIF